MEEQNSKSVPKDQRNGTRSLVSGIGVVWLILTGIGLYGGESFSKAGSLTVVSIIMGLLGGRVYHLLCRKSDWEVVFVLCALMSVSFGDHALLISPSDSLGSRFGSGLCGIIGSCVTALVVRWLELRKPKRLSPGHPLWDAHVDRANS